MAERSASEQRRGRAGWRGDLDGQFAQTPPARPNASDPCCRVSRTGSLQRAPNDANAAMTNAFGSFVPPAVRGARSPARSRCWPTEFYANNLVWPACRHAIAKSVKSIWPKVFVHC
jgi:hypothetical protein